MRIPRLEVWGSVGATVLSICLYRFRPLTLGSFIVLLLNLEGTIFLASSISFPIPSIGTGILGKLKWAIVEFPKYESPASFNPIRFYLGVLFLVLGAVGGVLVSSQS